MLMNKADDDIISSIKMILIITLTLVLLRAFCIFSSAGRCYLCNQNNLSECAGSEQADSTIYSEVLRYYTEPCNGQCVLFRDEKKSLVRGCSWTYGHMSAKPTGWHQISPGISAYFCDTYLCNNGTYESYQRPQMIAQIQPTWIRTNVGKQCYTCTERFPGCGEYLDPNYAMNYIRPCQTNCVIYRNPNDMNLITRDCATSWPEIRGRSGLQKILGADAFFCEASLCNGIGFDFIMGIFYNQMPSIMSLPRPSTSTLINLDDESVIWDDPDLDYADSTSFHTMEFTFPTMISSTDRLTLSDSPSTIQWWNETQTDSSMTTEAEEEEEDEDDLEPQSTMLYNTTSIPLITRFEHLAIDHENVSTTEVSTTFPTTFSTTTTTTTTKLVSSALVNTTRTSSHSPYEYCKNQVCYNGGRLNSDCLCICLPAYTGENCQTVLCDQEPAHICHFVLEDECRSEWIRYLCPKFCATKRCSPKLRHVNDYHSETFFIGKERQL